MYRHTGIITKIGEKFSHIKSGDIHFKFYPDCVTPNYTPKVGDSVAFYIVGRNNTYRVKAVEVHLENDDYRRKT